MIFLVLNIIWRLDKKCQGMLIILALIQWWITTIIMIWLRLVEIKVWIIDS